MFQNILKIISNKTFLFSLILHLLHGFLLEKSKLYYPYTFSRNILLIKTDLFKFYISSCFVFLGMPYVLSKLSPNKYSLSRASIENRYQSRTAIELQIGSYILGLSMILTGFCPSYIPMYLATSPILFFYSIAASYTAYIIYHMFGKLLFNRANIGPIHHDLNNMTPISNERDALNNIGRIIILSIGVILLLVFETSEQSVLEGHTSDELIDLIYNGDYLPPGLSGVLCGLINFALIFICNEYQTLTSEWLINIFYYTSDVPLDGTNITGQLCIEQILKILSMVFGVRLSLWTSRKREIPHIDWLFYSLVGFGSIFSAISACLTTATFSDHVYLINAFIGSISSEIISTTVATAWVLLYLAKLLGLSNPK